MKNNSSPTFGAMARRAWLILAFGLLLVFIVDRAYVFNIESYSAHEYLKKAEKDKGEKQRSNSPVLSFVADIEKFIDAHEKLLIVLATIAIAWFTATLWRATEGLFRMAEQQAADMRESLRIAGIAADAAESSANASIGVEVPRFVVTDVWSHVIDIGLDNEAYQIGVEIVFSNHGRTEAVLTRECIVYKITPALDQRPRYPLHSVRNINFGKVIHAGESHRCNLTFTLDAEQADSIKNNRNILWIYGYISYRDFLFKNRINGFVAALEPENRWSPHERLGRFVEEGPPAYTYSQYEGYDVA